jgi:TetR/AcrR family transcriptional regulator, fatty acid metabolism regulator protein
MIVMSVDGAHRSLREKQRQERQELILQAAEQVFSEKGYHDTSMDEIAGRVGIGTATIYSHFANKEDLLVAAIFERAFGKVTRRVREIAASQVSGAQKLTRLFQFLICSDFFLQRVQLFYALGNNPEAQKALLAHKASISGDVQAFSDTLAAVIERGKSAGEFRRDISTSTMLRAFISLVRAQSVADTLLGAYTDGSAEDILQLYLSGIGA